MESIMFWWKETMQKSKKESKNIFYFPFWTKLLFLQGKESIISCLSYNTYYVTFEMIKFKTTCWQDI